MLFLLFQLGKDRYALEASRVVEVLPLLELESLPSAPRGLTGLFNYRGQPVPALDLCELLLGRPARACLSTRVIVIHYLDGHGAARMLGLIAERATEMLRCDPKDFVETGMRVAAAPFWGPVRMDANGPVQWLQTQRLVPEPVRELLFAELKALPA
jgi:chemotaxis-related protein WspB